MIAATDGRRWIACWGVSILVHAGILIVGAVLLSKVPRFQVKAGETSMEIDLIAEPVPVVTIPSPTIAPPNPPPLPESPSIPIYKLMHPAVVPFSKPTFASPFPSVSPIVPKASQASAKPKTTETQQERNASRGAVSAQPDDLHNEPPAYPEDSRAAHEEGTVILQVEVTATGEPSNVAIMKTSGYFRLDQAAKRAVQKWKFHPALTAEIPVPSEATIPVHFKLQ